MHVPLPNLALTRGSVPWGAEGKTFCYAEMKRLAPSEGAGAACPDHCCKDNCNIKSYAEELHNLGEKSVLNAIININISWRMKLQSQSIYTEDYELPASVWISAHAFLSLSLLF